MCFSLGCHVYSFPTYSTSVPDLMILFALLVACLKRNFLYLVHIHHIELDNSQRVLQERCERHSTEVVKALLQQFMLIPG